MNITEALNQVLPEIPASMGTQHYPRLHPEVVFKQHIQEGQPMVRVFVPGVEAIFHFTPQNWEFAQLFNGQRTYEEIAALYFEQSGVQYTAEEVRDLADGLESTGFWYKTALEQNVVLMRKSVSERRRLLQPKKTKWGDLGLIMFPAVNPDRFLDWLHQRLRFMYTTWFTVVTLFAFAFTGWIFIDRWSDVSHDTFQFYNFADKTWGDLAAFWVLACVLMALHEIAHGLTCKHYGGRVPAMGFALVYLSPAFYTDTTQGMVMGNRYERLMISVAGVWSELILCAIATPLWWGTAPGSAAHEFAYTIILITGIGVVLINWNPLIKLDGYNMLCEILDIVDLKEASTIYVSSWIKKNVWRLPVEVPYVPKSRRMGYAAYAILSGVYSYTVLYVLASFVGNAFRNFNPEWSFVPELTVAGLIFRSRIRTLGNFMKFVYLDKKDRVRAWFTPRRSMMIAAVALVFLLLPLWHQSAEGPFVLEPVVESVVRSMVPGMITSVYADEGDRLAAGQPLATMSNLRIESQLARGQTDYQVAKVQAISAGMRYVNSGAAMQERDRIGRQIVELTSAHDSLEVKSPISGVVLTPRTKDRLGAYVPEGAELFEIGDLSRLRARLYISEPEVYKLHAASYGRLQVKGILGIWDSQSLTVAPVSSAIAPGLIDLTKYTGLRPPRFYVIDLLVANPNGELRPGMTGTARLYGQRASFAGLVWGNVANFFGRKIW